MVPISGIERRKVLEQELRRDLALLTQRADIQRVIVYGSLSSGQIHDWSDIDLVIVQETNLPFFQRLDQVREFLNPTVGTDILVYTPSEFETLARARAFVKEEIIAKGINLYERSRGKVVGVRA